MYGIRYLKTINHIPVSQCTTRLTRESKVDPRQPRRKGKKTSAPITPIQPRWFSTFNNWVWLFLETEMNSISDEMGNRHLSVCFQERNKRLRRNFQSKKLGRVCPSFKFLKENTTPQWTLCESDGIEASPIWTWNLAFTRESRAGCVCGRETQCMFKFSKE